MIKSQWNKMKHFYRLRPPRIRVFDLLKYREIIYFYTAFAYTVRSSIVSGRPWYPGCRDVKNRKKVESTRVNTIPPRSSSVDRRIGYGRDRLNSYEQMMNGKNASIKQAWVSVVDAQNIKDAKREAGKKLWFSLSPGKERFKWYIFWQFLVGNKSLSISELWILNRKKLTAYSGPSTQESEFCVRLCPKTNIKELDHDLSSRYYQLLVTLPLPVGGDVGSEKSITIGLLTEKIRKVWMDSIQQAIEQAGSRSSSISSNSEPTDITNKIER